MHTPVERHPLAAFLLVTVGFSWTVWTVGVLLFAAPLPAILLGAWGPTVAALVVTAGLGGRPAVRALLARLDPRVRGRWYAAALVVPFLVAGLASVAVLAAGGQHAPGLPGGLPLVALPAVLLVNVLVGGPVAEELGWRGFAQPRLRERYGTAGAGLVVGVVWALWHLPLFALGVGVAVGGFPFAWFLAAVVGYSLLLAWLADRTGDAVGPAIAFHAATNTAAGSLGLVPVDEPLALAAYVAVLWGTALALLAGRRPGRTGPGTTPGGAD